MCTFLFLTELLEVVTEYNLAVLWGNLGLGNTMHYLYLPVFIMSLQMDTQQATADTQRMYSCEGV